jgi:hypothetical protein
VYGAGDRHVPVEESVRRLRLAYQQGAHPDVTFVVIPRAGHGLQALATDHECISCPRGSVPAPLVPEAAELVDRWIIRHAQ